ncbi:MAG: MaoC family dehydratase [Pseudomonadota bacterium]
MTTQTYFIEDLSTGMQANSSRVTSREDIDLFANVSGDTNPLHLDETYAATTMFNGCIAHGMLSASYISKVLGTQLPGPGAVYLSQSLKFKAPVRPGDQVDTQVEITGLDETRRRVTLQCECRVGETVVLSGEAQLLVPARPAGG